MKKIILIIFTCLMLIGCAEEKEEVKNIGVPKEIVKIESINTTEEAQKSEDFTTTNEEVVGEEVNEVIVNEEVDEYIAEENDFKYAVFQNEQMQIIVFNEDGISIIGQYSTGRPTSIDTVLKNESHTGISQFEYTYENAQITLDGSFFYVTLNDEITLEFEKLGDRIIRDSESIRYYLQ